MSKKARADWWADGDDDAPRSPSGAQAPTPAPVAARSVLADIKARAQNAGARDGAINDNAKRVAELTDSFEAYLRMHELVASNSLAATPVVPVIDVAPPHTTIYEPALPLSNLFHLSNSFNNSLSLSDLLSGRVEAALAASIQRDQLQQQLYQQQLQQQQSQFTPAAAEATSASTLLFSPPLPPPPSVAPPSTLEPAHTPVATPMGAPPAQTQPRPTVLSVPSTVESRIIRPDPLVSPARLADLPASSDVARLSIVQQPGPKSLWKNRAVTPPFAVRVLGAPGVTLKETGPVRAYLVSDSPERIELDGATVRFDASNTATFTQLRFNKGSHQHLSHLYFECQVVATDGRIVTLSSPPSDPFIVCTNISQWLGSEKKILKRVCFGDESHVRFEPTFRTHLQAHFSRAVCSDRELSSSDIAYIHAWMGAPNLGGQEYVSHEAFEVFWTWYGPALKEVYEKAGHARLLWERYWLFGFMSEETAREHLAGQPPGTFLLAFSEITPVFFWRKPDGSVGMVDPKGPLREAMIAHTEFTQMLCMGADGVLRVMPKLLVVKGIRRRKDSEAPILL